MIWVVEVQLATGVEFWLSVAHHWLVLMLDTVVVWIGWLVLAVSCDVLRLSCVLLVVSCDVLCLSCEVL